METRKNITGYEKGDRRQLDGGDGCAELCLFAQSCPTPWTAAHQAPLSIVILQARMLEWVPCPPPGDLPNPGLPHCRWILYQLSYQGSLGTARWWQHPGYHCGFKRALRWVRMGREDEECPSPWRGGVSGSYPKASLTVHSDISSASTKLQVTNSPEISSCLKTPETNMPNPPMSTF